MLISHLTEASERCPSPVSLTPSLTDEGGPEAGAEQLMAGKIAPNLGQGEGVELHQAKGRIHNTRQKQKQSPWEIKVPSLLLKERVLDGGQLCVGGQGPNALVRRDAKVWTRCVAWYTLLCSSVRNEWKSIPWLRCWSLQHTDTFYPQALLHSLRISKLLLKGSRVMQEWLFQNSPNAVLTRRSVPITSQAQIPCSISETYPPQILFFSSNNLLLRVLQASISVFVFNCPQCLFLPWVFPAAFLNPHKVTAPTSSRDKDLHNLGTNCEKSYMFPLS